MTKWYVQDLSSRWRSERRQVRAVRRSRVCLDIPVGRFCPMVVRGIRTYCALSVSTHFELVSSSSFHLGHTHLGRVSKDEVLQLDDCILASSRCLLLVIEMETLDSLGKPFRLDYAVRWSLEVRGRVLIVHRSIVS